MFCNNCGKEIEAGSKFCRFCGKTVESDQAQAPICPPSGGSKPKPDGGFLFGILLAVCGIAVLCVGIYFGVSKIDVPSSGSEGSEPEEPAEVLANLEEDRPRICEGSVKKLPKGPQRITTEIVTKGKGENAKWGLKTSGSFILVYNFVCDSEILEKHETPMGEIKVRERRIFKQIRQELNVSDVDAGFAFHECLPMKGILGVFGLLFGPTATASIATGVSYLEGKTARGVLGLFGTDLDKQFEDKINEFISSHLTGHFFKNTDMEGRPYILTYLQDEGDGKPSMMKAEREDGVLLTEEERLILRRANVFMDSQMVPDGNCSPGDSWKVNSGDFSCLLDPFVNGKYDGEVSVCRQDDEDGLWKMKLAPATIAVKSDGGKTTGNVNLVDGVAYYDNEGHVIHAMQIGGNGTLRNLTRHHFLFTARLEGACEFSAVLKTEAKPADGN